MKAIRIHQHGGPEVLVYEEVATPTPGPGEALVKIEASGVNFIDVYRRVGLYPAATPFTLGEEAAGVVAALGAGVEDLRVGDRVASTNMSGAYAEYAVAPAARLVPGGAHSWHPMSYDPQSGLVFIPAQDAAFPYMSQANWRPAAQGCCWCRWPSGAAHESWAPSRPRPRLPWPAPPAPTK